MFEIRIDGRIADLNPNASLELSLESPVFNHDSFDDPVKALLPELPNTPSNREILNHFNLLQSSVLNTRKRVDNYLNGHLLASGVFVLQEASDSGFKGGVTENLGEFFGEYQSQLITELDFGVITIPTPVPATISDGSTIALYFPKLLNPSFYSGQYPTYTGTINAFIPGVVVSSSPLVPEVSVLYLFKKITELTGVTITGDVIDHPDFQKLVFISLREVSVGDIKISDHLPTITLGELFIELRKSLNLHFTFNTRDKSLTIDFLEFTEIVQNWQSIAESRQFKIPEQNSRMAITFELDPSDAYQKANPTILAETISASAEMPDGGITKITCKFSSILRDTATGLGILDQPGISVINGQQDKKTNPRLAFVNDSSSGLTAHLIAPSGNFSLSPSSLLATRYQQISAIRSGAFYLKKKMLITELQLARLNWLTPIYFNGMLWLLLATKPKFPITEPTECLFIKI